MLMYSAVPQVRLSRLGVSTAQPTPRIHTGVRRSDFALGAAAGACLRDLNVLPELAPCYVATERALVIGWNEASLTPALATRAASAPDGASASGSAVIDFARFAQADARFARRLQI